MAEQMKVDSLIQSITELTETVKAHNENGDQATIDYEKLAEVLGAKQQELIDSQPVRKGELIGPEGFQAENPVVKEGKYAGMKASDVQFVAKFLERASALGAGRVATPSADLVKALTSTGSGSGDELVPTAMAASLWEDFFTASRVVGQFDRISQPSDPFDLPLGLGDVTWYKGSENTATTATDVATAKVTLTTTEQVAEVNWSYTLDEDSIVAVLPSLRKLLARNGAQQMDQFMMNADSTNAGTGNINLDDADPADTKWYLSGGQDGLRHQYLVDADSGSGLGVDAGGDALTDADILGMLGNLGKYATNPDRCVMFPEIATYLKGMLNLDGVQTMDKYGQNAVLLTGELARYRGVPVVPSAAVPLAEADGKVSTTAGNNTLGQIVCCHRDMWIVGFRRQLLMEIDRDIQKRQFILVVSFRQAVGAHGTRASAIHTSGVYNILV